MSGPTRSIGGRIVVATRNPGKTREFARLLAGIAEIGEIVNLSDYAEAPEVAEDADNYRDNALAKARSAQRHTGLIALADDSGLEVDALGGDPGVRSARFAADYHYNGETNPTTPQCRGVDQVDTANIGLLLSLLAGTPMDQRGARFRCVIAVVSAVRELVVEGTCEGLISESASGDNGFGYDPVFFHPASNKTFAELNTERKSSLSHRAAACKALAAELPLFFAALA